MSFTSLSNSTNRHEQQLWCVKGLTLAVGECDNDEIFNIQEIKVKLVSLQSSNIKDITNDGWHLLRMWPGRALQFLDMTDVTRALRCSSTSMRKVVSNETNINAV